MELLITYDIDTTTPEGERRLRRVATTCEGHGHRVQKSVFEIICTPAQRLTLEDTLTTLINPQTDSIRIYQLDRGTFTNTTHLGNATTPPHHGALIL
ncbi:CRISPR-associated endonuclease Cas2 [Actinokineospora guangxiensis]|uniref:CRISPR-associated endoribonuclease Cas2 n=1 Tax=Actinokineospora guangxiensis TaxID=1490288 RepID=A0ABW0ERP8_9PSEU